ncbi:MAG: amidase [bacterium]
MSDLVFHTVNQLASAIRERKVSAMEVLKTQLSHIAQHNPALNAIVTLNEDRALQRAKEADSVLAQGELWGPLHGVPVTIKDAFETAGLRTTSSHKPLADYVPKQDATVVARLRAAGAIILGKTNMPELAMDVQCNSPLFGRANNPWDLGRTPGGSTGGGAAAVAAGLSPLEMGSDVGGSIRLPAHFCGVFGLKPTEHRVSGAGHIPGLPGDPKSVRYLRAIGPLARSVEDLKLCLSIIAGPDGRDWDIPPVPLDNPSKRALPELRFAWTDNFGGVPVTTESRAVLNKLARSLTELGCRVERHNPPGFDFEDAWETYGEILGTAVGVHVPLPLRVLGYLLGPIMYMNDPTTRATMRGFGLIMQRFVKALTRRDALMKSMENFLSKWDAWLCPVSSTPAFTHRKSSMGWPGKHIEVDSQKVPYWVGSMSYTTVLNLTGNPVVVLPLARSKDGLPIGVQVVGRRWHDLELLDIAAKIVEVTGGYQRPPGY